MLRVMAVVRWRQPSRRTWCGLVGIWSLVFAAPHFYWALGGRAGLGAQAAAADAALQQAWFAAYNLVAGGLGLLGAVAAALIAFGIGARLHRYLLIASVVACVLLLSRGALGLGLLGAAMLDGQSSGQTPVILLAIEPWFVLGGMAFGGLVLSQRRQPPAPAARRTD